MVLCEHSYGKFRRCARCGGIKNGYEVVYVTNNWAATSTTLNYTATFTDAGIHRWDVGRSYEDVWQAALWRYPLTEGELRRQRNAESRRRSRAVIARLARETPSITVPTKRPMRIVARARSTI